MPADSKPVLPRQENVHVIPQSLDCTVRNTSLQYLDRGIFFFAVVTFDDKLLFYQQRHEQKKFGKRYFLFGIVHFFSCLFWVIFITIWLI